MAWNTVGNLRGPQGDQGIQGLQGPQGIQGEMGPVGPAGLTFRGAFDPAATYVPNDTVAFGGTTYVALDPAPAVGVAPTEDPDGDDGAVNDGWAVLALEGARGPQGIQGIQGEQGVQGERGVDGAVGPQGATGATGTRGSQWYVGTGAPADGAYADALAGDKYLDSTTGDVYTFA